MNPFPATTPDLWRQSSGYTGDRFGTSGSAVETGNTCFTDGDEATAGDETKDANTWWYLLLTVIPVFTVFGNVLICLSVWREATLQTVTNYFIVSLAIADIMVAILVMPLAIYVQVNDNVWRLGDALCDTWVAFDVMCCTASILNLTAISIDRFIAVTQPLRYARHKNSKPRVYVTLASTWVVSVTVSLPIAVGWNYTERRRETPWLCTFYNADFLIYSSMASFYIPCLLMTLLYYKTFRAILRQAERKRLLKKEKKMTDQKEEIVKVETRLSGTQVKEQGQGKRSSRVSAPTQSTTDSEMSENSGSACSVFEERISRSTLLRVFTTREDTSLDSIGDQEGTTEFSGCRNECQDNGETASTMKNSEKSCTNDGGSKSEMDKFRRCSIGEESEKLWSSEKKATSGSMERFQAERNTGWCNGERNDPPDGSRVLAEPKLNASCYKQQFVDRKSTKQAPRHKECDADSHEESEFTCVYGVEGCPWTNRPAVDNSIGIGELSNPEHHDRQDGKRKDACMKSLYSGTPVNSLSYNYRKSARLGNGKERRSSDFADSIELGRRERARERLLSHINIPKQTNSSVGDDSRNTKSSNRDQMSVSAHWKMSPHASKVSEQTSSFAKEMSLRNREVFRFTSRENPTKSIPSFGVRKRSTEILQATMEGLRETETVVVEIPERIMPSPKTELQKSTSLIQDLTSSAARGCQVETLPSPRLVRKEALPSIKDRQRIILVVSGDEEQEVFDTSPYPKIRKDHGNNLVGSTMSRKESEFFPREVHRRSFDLSNNGLISIKRPTGSTKFLYWQNVVENNRLDTNEYEMIESGCSGDRKPVTHNQLNRRVLEVRHAPSNPCPDSGPREVPRTYEESGTKDEETERNESSTSDIQTVLGDASGTSDGQTTCSNRDFQLSAHRRSQSPLEETRSHRPSDPCESRPLTRNFLTGERIRPRDYSSHHHHDHRRAPAQHSSISVPARLEPPRVVGCRRDEAMPSGRFEFGRSTRPLLTARQRDALIETRSDGYQVTGTHVAPGREKRDKMFTKRERKATTTLAIVLGVFLLCWVPFFTLNIVNAVCIRYDLFDSSSICSIHKVAFDVFVWLGYFNSFFNPVIYTIFNAEFRKAFKRLFVEPRHR